MQNSPRNPFKDLSRHIIKDSSGTASRFSPGISSGSFFLKSSADFSAILLESCWRFYSVITRKIFPATPSWISSESLLEIFHGFLLEILQWVFVKLLERFLLEFFKVSFGKSFWNFSRNSSKDFSWDSFREIPLNFFMDISRNSLID